MSNCSRVFLSGMSHRTLYVLAQLRRWASFLIEYQICLENSSISCRKSRQKVEHIRPKPAFPHHFGRPPPLPAAYRAHLYHLSFVFTKIPLIERHLEYLLQRAYDTRILQYNISSSHFQEKNLKIKWNIRAKKTRCGLTETGIALRNAVQPSRAMLGCFQARNRGTYCLLCRI